MHAVIAGETSGSEAELIHSNRSMRLREMELFDAVMRTETVTEAALYLSISQPAVSKGIRELELRVGFPLFARMKGRLRPTEEARQLFRTVGPIFSALEAARREVASLRDENAGRVVIAASPTYAASIASSSVRWLRQGRKSNQIEILSMPSPAIMDTVSQRRADLGIASAPFGDAEAEMLPIGAFDLVAIMLPDHALAGRKAVLPSDLTHENIICFSEISPSYGSLREIFRKEGVPFRPSALVNHSMSALALVIQGGGVALIDPFLLLSGCFPALAWRRFEPAIPIRSRILLPRDRSRSRLVELIISLIQADFRLLQERYAAQANSIEGVHPAS